MKAYKIITKREGKCAVSYCFNRTEYRIGKPTTAPSTKYPLFCFESLETAINFVYKDYKGTDNPQENVKKHAVYECDIAPSRIPGNMVISWSPAGTITADSVVLKKKVFDFAVDKVEDIKNNKTMKIDTKALKLVLDDVERYEILYEKDGYNEWYTVSGAIDKSENTVTVYCFGGKGVRSFKWNKILSIKKIEA